MGNRAVITTPERKVGLYVHWNGGRDTIEPLLEYCRLKGYRAPESDEYGWARLCQVLGNFFGGTTSVGIGAYSTDTFMDPGDNGIYIIEGWKIAERIVPYEDFTEQQEYDFDDMLRSFDECMPESERLGDFLDSVEVPVSELKLGDEVWMRNYDGAMIPFPVIGFNDEGRAYVERYDHDGDYSWNSNNYPQGDTCRIKPRR